ncbi:Inosine/uridine-preferring nucleoside hydrolase domain-containing protein [Chytriomyces sp. MP71]|nr:Inosine/uridine-preferring nucleoside hydrolase domain-containing protein [Chytriomyces sp. MP71]
MAGKVLLDTDMGVDDTTSLVMLLRDPGIQVQAISVVDGNVSVDAGVAAVHYVLQLCDRNGDIPVYRGAGGALLPPEKPKECWPGHGKDGFGNFTTRESEWNCFAMAYFRAGNGPQKVEEESAAAMLVRAARHEPNQLSLLALGPLTNVALAISLDPGFLANIKELVVMGGSHAGRGNSNRTAEFNFHCDPEAVHIVLHAASLLPTGSIPKVTIVPWETTVDHGLPWTFFDKLAGRSDASKLKSKYSQFIEGYVKTYEGFGRKEQQSLANHDKLSHIQAYFMNMDKFCMCDIYATICIVDPTAVTEYKDLDTKIELAGTHTRGMLAFDWHDFGNSAKPNCRVIFGFDMAKLMDAMEKAFRP